MIIATARRSRLLVYLIACARERVLRAACGRRHARRRTGRPSARRAARRRRRHCRARLTTPTRRDHGRPRLHLAGPRLLRRGAAPTRASHRGSVGRARWTRHHLDPPRVAAAPARATCCTPCCGPRSSEPRRRTWPGASFRSSSSSSLLGAHREAARHVHGARVHAASAPSCTPCCARWSASSTACAAWTRSARWAGRLRRRRCSSSTSSCSCSSTPSCACRATCR